MIPDNLDFYFVTVLKRVFHFEPRTELKYLSISQARPNGYGVGDVDQPTTYGVRSAAVTFGNPWNLSLMRKDVAGYKQARGFCCNRIIGRSNSPPHIHISLDTLNYV